jgi:hypothetical protein
MRSSRGMIECVLICMSMHPIMKFPETTLDDGRKVGTRIREQQHSKAIFVDWSALPECSRRRAQRRLRGPGRTVWVPKNAHRAGWGCAPWRRACLCCSAALADTLGERGVVKRAGLLAPVWCCSPNR